MSTNSTSTSGSGSTTDSKSLPKWDSKNGLNEMLDEVSGGTGTSSTNTNNTSDGSSGSGSITPPPVTTATVVVPPKPPVTKPTPTPAAKGTLTAPVGMLVMNTTGSVTGSTTGTGTASVLSSKRVIGHTGVKRATLGAKKIGISKPKPIAITPLDTTTSNTTSGTATTTGVVQSGELNIAAAFDSINIKIQSPLS